MGIINCLVTHIIQISSLFSSEERNLYKFGTTWLWVNDDNFWVTKHKLSLKTHYFIFDKSVYIQYLAIIADKEESDSPVWK